MDDEKALANTVSMLVRLSGHDSVVAYSGEQALSTASSFRPDVLVTDYSMPGMNGFQLATCIAQQYPGCRLFLLTACLDVSRFLPNPCRPNVTVLQKPLAPSNLLAAIGILRSSYSQAVQCFSRLTMLKPIGIPLAVCSHTRASSSSKQKTGKKHLTDWHRDRMPCCSISTCPTSMVLKSAEGFGPRWLTGMCRLSISPPHIVTMRQRNDRERLAQMTISNSRSIPTALYVEYVISFRKGTLTPRNFRSCRPEPRESDQPTCVAVTVVRATEPYASGRGLRSRW